MNRRAVAVALWLGLSALGCMDVSRVNSECRWTDGPARRLDLTRGADREHLRVDVQVANELMVRFGDVHYRNRPDMARPLREQCIGALTDTIVATHGVTRADVHAAGSWRVWWADALAVYLPMALLIAFAMAQIVRRVCRSFDSGDRAIAMGSVALLAPLVALVGMGVTQFWSFSVESWFLRDGHVSNRASFIPVVAHGWWTYGVALAICAVVAVIRYRATPLAGSNDSYGARRRGRMTDWNGGNSVHADSRGPFR